VKYDADLVLTKQATDIIVVGHAYAPQGRAVTMLDVGVRVGPVRKVLRVFGERRWEIGGLTAPASFTKMPLVYERAYGGADALSTRPEQDWDWRNPVGRGFAVAREHLMGAFAPNIESSERLIGAWDDRPAPAGLGVIASHWQPRIAFAGTYGDAWMQHRNPLVPDDFDERFYQSAPADQQAPGFLAGGEPVVLLNLSSQEIIRFTLPKLYLGFDTRFYDGTHEIHKQRKLHSVIIEPDFPRVSLVWHSALPCHFKVQKLDRTRITLKTRLNHTSREPAQVQLEEA
jgi:hypothetical protein